MKYSTPEMNIAFVETDDVILASVTGPETDEDGKGGFGDDEF